MPSPDACRRHVPFILWAGLPLIAAAFLRLRGIGELEPFVDEGANILTALDPRVRVAFEPLEQGRPLLVWLFLPCVWFPGAALEIARIMTAFAGLATITTVGLTLHMLAGRSAALLGMWIWAVLPMAVWHERLALQDPFVTALLSGAIAMVTAGSRREARNGRAWLAAAGLSIGTAFLLKISALLTFPWLGLMYIGIQHHFGRALLDRRIAWIALGALAPVVMLGSDLLRLGSRLHDYDALPKLAGNVGVAALNRFETWVGWYLGYGGWALLLLLALAIAIAIRWRLALGLVCAASWGASLLISSFILNNVYARYTLPDHLPLVFFVALTIGSVSVVRWSAVAQAAGVCGLAWWGWVALQIGINPARAAVPRADIEQYVTGRWSGRGVHEIHRYLADFAVRNDTRSVVFVHRFLRPGCYGLLLAELGDPRLAVVPFTIYQPEELSTAMALLTRRAGSTERFACFILYESYYPVQPWLGRPGSPTRLELTVERGGSEAFSLYRVMQ